MMETLISARTVPIAGILAKMRLDHALTPERLAALFGVPASVLKAWECDGVSVSRAIEQQAHDLARRLSYASLAAVKFRTGKTTRPELLMDRELTVLTVSPGMLLQRTRDGRSEVQLPPGFFVGRHINDILPSLDCNLILTPGSGLNELHDIGFFARRVRCVRICAELCFGDITSHGVGEFWPTETVDAGVLVQLTLHATHAAKNTLRTPGVVVHWTEIMPADDGHAAGARE
jgi:hypothetical protein